MDLLNLCIVKNLTKNHFILYWIIFCVLRLPSRDHFWSVRARARFFFSSVNILMCFKVDKQREELVAVRTRVRLFPCVNILMCFKVAKLREELLTVRTRVRISPVWIFLCVLRVPG